MVTTQGVRRFRWRVVGFGWPAGDPHVVELRSLPWLDYEFDDCRAGRTGSWSEASPDLCPSFSRNLARRQMGSGLFQVPTRRLRADSHIVEHHDVGCDGGGTALRVTRKLVNSHDVRV